MTKRELMERLGLTLEEMDRRYDGWWNRECWKLADHLDERVDNYDLWCDQPFNVLNVAYNVSWRRMEAEAPTKGLSTYEWLEERPTDTELAYWEEHRKEVRHDHA